MGKRSPHHADIVSGFTLHSRRLKRQHKYIFIYIYMYKTINKNKQTKRQTEPKMSKNSVQRALSCFSKKQSPLTCWWRRLSSPPSFVSSPHFNSSQTTTPVCKSNPPVHHHHHQVSLLLLSSHFRSSVSAWTDLLPLQARGWNDAVFLTR